MRKWLHKVWIITYQLFKMALLSRKTLLQTEKEPKIKSPGAKSSQIRILSPISRIKSFTINLDKMKNYCKTRNKL